jgi:hypothetical protein
VLFDTRRRSKTPITFVIYLIILIDVAVTAPLVQRDFGRVEVTNMTYQSYNYGHARLGCHARRLSRWIVSRTGRVAHALPPPV